MTKSNELKTQSLFGHASLEKKGGSLECFDI